MQLPTTLQVELKAIHTGNVETCGPEQVKGEREKKKRKKKSQKGEGTPPDRADFFSLVNCFTQGFYVPFLSLFL